MSSSEENSVAEDSYRPGFQTGDGDDGSEGGFSRKRKGRACDTCRRRKVKCDGTNTSNRSCTNCVTWKSPCTYANPSKRRIPIPPGYVEALKDRIRKLEGILSELFPNAKIRATDLTAETLRRSLLLPGTLMTRDIVPIRGQGHEAMPNSGDSPTPESERLLLMHARRFHGQSSGAMFLTDALNLKHESTNARAHSPGPDKPVFSNPAAGLFAVAKSYYSECTSGGLLTRGPPPKFMFPPEDLVESLVFLFFEKISPLLPILHRPTFHSQYRSQLHTRDPEFAIILLLVCAAASRYSDDIRVLPAAPDIPRKPDSEPWLSAGLDYYTQVYHLLSRPLTQAPVLSDLQKCALACLYLQGSKFAPYSWSLSGFGIRLALEAGAHRKKRGEDLTVESQLWNRAFWALVTWDRFGSATTGRPCAIYDEDIDVDLPIAVDDEYWDPPDPRDAWKQPSGKPAIAEHFRAMLKLLEILAFTLRTVYSSNKSKLMLGLVGPSWEQRVVSEIDSALNKWIDSIPDHLRWNPHQENPIFFNQSTLLYCLYYHIQILVHRPFIPIAPASSPLSFPSLAICTNAARASSHVLEINLRKGDAFLYMNNCAFTAGIVLLFNVWGVKRLGLRADPGRHMQDIFKCMDYLKVHSERWAKAKLAWDIISELLSVGDFPQPQPSATSHVLAGTKRPHGLLSQNEFEGTKFAGSTDTSAHFHAHNSIAQDDLFSSSTRAVDVQSSSAPFNDVASQPVPEPWQSTGLTQMKLPFTSEDLSIPPLHPELYYADGPGTMQSNTPRGDQGYSVVSHTNPAEDSNVPQGSEGAWAGVEQRGFSMGGGAGPSPAVSSGQQGHAQPFPGDNVTRPYNSDQEMFLGQSMWATAPPSFAAQDWGEFAHGFQLEEQMRLTDIYSGGVS